jgi:tetratricopeptide (TPR) repeat protein
LCLAAGLIWLTARTVEVTAFVARKRGCERDVNAVNALRFSERATPAKSPIGRCAFGTSDSKQETSMARFSISRLSTSHRHYIFLASVAALSAFSIVNAFENYRASAGREAMARCANVTIPAATAIAACSTVIDRAPKAGWAYANRGLAYSSSFQPDRAIADLDTAIGIDPDYARAYAVRAVVYGVKGDREREIADYTSAITLNPADAQSYSNRAVAHFQNGETELAIADASQAIEINPKLAAAYVNRAAAHKKTGDLAHAIEDYRSALAINPADQTSADGLKRLGSGG